QFGYRWPESRATHPDLGHAARAIKEDRGRNSAHAVLAGQRVVPALGALPLEEELRPGHLLRLDEPVQRLPRIVQADPDHLKAILVIPVIDPPPVRHPIDTGPAPGPPKVD